MSDSSPVSSRVVNQARQAYTWLQRALQRRGQERNIVLELAKCVSASVVSYLVAVGLVSSPMPGYAPIAALLVIQATLYRTLLTSIYYPLAVATGIGCVGLFTVVAGENLWTLVVVVIVGLLAGRWHRLGSYGPHLAVAGLFVFSAGGGDDLSYLLQLLATVGVGALFGTVTNVLAAPLARPGRPVAALDDLSSAISNLVSDIAADLRGEDALSNATNWRYSTDELGSFVRRARIEIEFEEEGEYVNPRRILNRARVVYYREHRSAVNALARTIDQLTAITRSLEYLATATHGRKPTSMHPEFTTAYADLLDAIAETVRAFGGRGRGGADEVREYLEAADARHSAATDQASSTPRDRAEHELYGALVVDAGRFLEELRTTASQ